MKRAALLAVLAASAAVFLTALDQTVVVTALPQIIVDLQIPINQLDRAAWIISGYLLGFVIAMPLMGRVSDLYGRRRVFIICLSIFAVGSLFCALSPVLGGSIPLDFLQNVGIDVSSPGLIWLVAARFVQAAGGGAVVPVAMAVAGDFYGEKHRGLALGLIGMVTEAGGVLGPLYGSVIVQYGGFSVPLGESIVQVSGWQSIFWLNVPIVALLLVLIWRLVPSGVGEHYDKGKRGPARAQIDVVGALLFGASLLCLSTGLAQEAAQMTFLRGGHANSDCAHASGGCIAMPPQAQTNPAIGAPGSAPIQNNPWLIAAAVVLLGGFIVYEVFVERGGEREGRRGVMKHASTPLVEVSMFRKVNFSASAVVSLLVGAALIIAMADIPIFIATVLGRPAIDSGLALLRLTAMIPVGALLGGWLCARISCRVTAVLGLIAAAVGFWLMHLWPLDVGWTQITVSTVIGGLGFGLVIAPIGTTAINAASRGEDRVQARTAPAQTTFLRDGHANSDCAHASGGCIAMPPPAQTTFLRGGQQPPPAQTGMAASVVTVLRMVGMILGLAALTSWGLGRFRALAAAFHPPANVPVFSAQYNTLYGQYLVVSAHEVYTAIFLAAGVLCIVALLPAFLLDGREPSPYVVRIDNDEDQSIMEGLEKSEGR